MTQNKPRPQRASFSGERGRTAQRHAAHAASFPPSPGHSAETCHEPAFCSLCGEGILFSPCDWFFGTHCALSPLKPLKTDVLGPPPVTNLGSQGAGT